MLSSEAKRANPPWNYGLWTLATIVLLAAIGLQPINNRAPEIGAFLTSIFSSPVAWFVLFIGLFLALRPFWIKTPDTAKQDEASKIILLGKRGLSIARQITSYRETKRLWRSDLPSIQPTVMDGVSLLLSFEKEGIAVPQFNAANPYAAAVGLEQYFSVISPLIRDGHIQEMREAAPDLAKAADQVCHNFSGDRFWTANDW